MYMKKFPNIFKRKNTKSEKPVNAEPKEQEDAEAPDVTEMVNNEAEASEEQMRDIKGLIQSFFKKAASGSGGATSVNPQAFFPNVLKSISKGDFTRGQYAFLSQELRRAQQGEVAGRDLQEHFKVLDENYEDWSKDMPESESARNNPEGERQDDTPVEADAAPGGEDQGGQERPVEEGEVGEDADVVTQYAQAAHTVDHMLTRRERASLLSKETRKEGVRRLLDTLFKRDEKPSADAGWVKDFLASTLDGVEVGPEKISAVQNYITVKERFDTEWVRKMDTLTKRMGGENTDEGTVETALETLTIFEQHLVEEEIRLREQMNGDNKAVEKVKQLWGYLGDKNLASYLEKKDIYKAKNTLWGKVKYSALRAASLRTAAMAALVPLAGFGFGAAGVATAIGLRRGIGGVMGASGGYALARRWLEKDLKKKVDGLPKLEDFNEKNYKQVVDLKKEYDAFILEHRANTAEQIGVGAEYEELQNMYAEAIKHFCSSEKKAAELRMKQNLSTAKERNIVKKTKNMAILFGSAALGGAVSAVVAPKVFDVAHDLGAGLVDADTGGGAAQGVKEPAIVSNADEAVKDLVELRGVKPKSSFTAPEEAKPPQQDVRPTIVRDLDEAVKDSAESQEATPSLNEALEGVKPPHEVLEQQGGVGIDGDATETAPEQSANTQEEGNLNEAEKQTAEEGVRTEETETVSSGPEETSSTETTDTDSAETAESTREFALEDGFYTVQEGDSLSKIWLAANGGDTEQMLTAMEALENLEGSPEGREQLVAFGIDSRNTDLIHPDDRINIAAIQEWLEGGDIQTDTATVGEEVPAQQTPAPEAGESAADVAKQEEVEGEDEEVTQPPSEEQGEDKEVAQPTAVEQKGGSDKGGEKVAPLLREDLDLPKGSETLEHLVSSGENTVADVFMNRGYEINNIPEEVLQKEVFEGHEIDIYLAENGQVLGVQVDGEPLMDESALQRAVKPAEVGAVTEMSVGEKLPFTGNFATLVETAETLNADMLADDPIETYHPDFREVAGRIYVRYPNGTPIMAAEDLRQFRPDLFESDQEAITADIARTSEEFVNIETRYPLQKRFLVETNQKGVLDHNYVQKEFDTIQKTVEGSDRINIARSEVIHKALKSLAVEKPPANPKAFDFLSAKLAAKISENSDLAERMFSEKGWGDERIRVAYSDDQRSLEVQERVNVNKGKRNMRPRWAWKSVLVEKITGKK